MLPIKHVCAAILLLALGACATQSEYLELAEAAERLERSAVGLRDKTVSDADTGQYGRDVQQFTSEVADFRRMVEARGGVHDDLLDSFANLSETYAALQKAIDLSHSREAEIDFEGVSTAYTDVERELRRQRSRVASD